VHSDDIAKYVAERQRHASRQSLGHSDAHRDASVRGHGSSVESGAFSPDGKRIVTNEPHNAVAANPGHGGGTPATPFIRAA